MKAKVERCVKRDLSNDHLCWERVAVNRNKWCKVIIDGRKLHDPSWFDTLVEKKRRLMYLQRLRAVILTHSRREISNHEKSCKEPTMVVVFIICNKLV